MGLLDSIFKTKKPSEVAASQTVAPENDVNPDVRQIGETYEHWGLRMCAKVSGSVMALTPFLHKVYLMLYNEQAKDEKLQEAKREQIKAEIDTKNNVVLHKERQVLDKDTAITKCNNEIEELKDEKRKIQEENEKINKMEKLKMIIGLSIIIPLTIYLFVFYSSTFYSAFFRSMQNVGSNFDVSNAMFDPNALSNALAGSVVELIFVIFAPIIFLGLGFCLHFFSKQQGLGKYVKAGAILLVTVAFDSILAYKIGQQLYLLEQLIGTKPLDIPYSVGLAVEDPNTWAVIFCGFIAYVIWGLVFDMTMSAYDNMSLSKTTLQHIDERIDELKASEAQKTKEKQTLLDEILALKNEMIQLTTKLNTQIIIDKGHIRLEMNNFIAGWITQLTVFGKAENDQKEAQGVFDTQVEILLNSK